MHTSLKKIFSLCCISLIFICCKTLEKPKESKQSSHTPDHLTNDFNNLNIDDIIPPILWSYEKRKMMAHTYYLIAEHNAFSGDIQKAIHFFQMTYDLDPNPFVGSKLIAAKATTGKLEEAVIDAKKMSLLYPKSAVLHFMYGQILAKTGQYKQAISELQKAISLEKNREEYYIELATIHSLNKNLIDAKLILEELLKEQPLSLKGWLLLAKLRLLSNQKNEAVFAARMAYKLQANNPEVILVYALALEMSGDTKNAVYFYEQIYNLLPSNDELLDKLIQLYKSLGDLQQSLDIIENHIANSSNLNPILLLQKALILWDMQKYDEASKILLDLSEKYPNQDRIQYMSALAQEKIKNYEKAISIYSAIPKQSMFWIHAQFRLAIILGKQKKYNEALKIIYAIESEPVVMWEIYFIGANFLGEQKKYKEAIELLTKGYKRFPNQHNLLFLIGVYQEKLNLRKESIETMKKLVELDPKNSAALNFLGYMYAEDGVNLDEAESLIKKALALKPNDAYYLDSLGWVYYQKKEFKKALKYLLEAIEIEPNEGVILEHLADVYVVFKKYNKAKKYYEKALKTKLEERDQIRIEKKYQTFLNLKFKYINDGK